MLLEEFLGPMGLTQRELASAPAIRPPKAAVRGDDDGLAQQDKQSRMHGG